ncbi:MAG: sigma 54-interacting transcriptional regulator [Spirochaetaceae bacterium]|nr:sigma 54-interacting transcriptional regulator [Spirochaetaceae bacterium]
MATDSELELLFDIARTFDAKHDFGEALSAVFALMEARAGISGGKVAFIDKERGLLCNFINKDEIIRLGEGLEGRVFETGIGKIEENCCCVPIRRGSGRGSEFIGTLSAETRNEAFLERVSSIIYDAVRLRIKLVEDYKKEAEQTARPVSAHKGNIIGSSKAIVQTLAEIAQVAPSDASVLITGESGTGKELAAAEIERLSRRAGKAFIKVNCGALPESIIESELFGHEKGAFTGAVAMRKGRFEMADGGTLFLDEIGDAPLQIQVKLLRVLQEHELERVGGSGTIKVDVRLIAATNKDLQEEVQAGRFREDLYYRLHVFPIHLPPLRERKTDIVLLADYFAEKLGTRHGKPIKRISTPAIDMLTSYSWPGNVRELENCIERAVLLSTDSVIHSYHLPPSLQTAEATHTEPTATLDAALSRLEKEMIIEALKISEGNMSLAARALGISERRMGLRVSHYGIAWKNFRK